MNEARFEVYESTKTSDWRWRLRAKNGEIVAQGEGYRDKNDAFRGIAAVKRAAADVGRTKVF